MTVHNVSRTHDNQKFGPCIFCHDEEFFVVDEKDAEVLSHGACVIHCMRRNEKPSNVSVLSDIKLPHVSSAPKKHQELLQKVTSNQHKLQIYTTEDDVPSLFCIKSTDPESLCSLTNDNYTKCYNNEFKMHFGYNDDEIMEEDKPMQGAKNFLLQHFKQQDKIMTHLSKGHTLMIHSIDSKSSIVVISLVNHAMFFDFLYVNYIAVNESQKFLRMNCNNGDDKPFRNRGIATKMSDMMFDQMLHSCDNEMASKACMTLQSNKSSLSFYKKRVFWNTIYQKKKSSCCAIMTWNLRMKRSNQ